MSTIEDTDISHLDFDLDDQDPEKVAHIVVMPGHNVAAEILRARIEGTPIQALCGHVFVPKQNPESLPVCKKCEEIYAMLKQHNPNLFDKPSY